MCAVSQLVCLSLTLHAALPPLRPCLLHCPACSKHAIVVADKKLGNACTIHETIRVKSAAWDDNGGWLWLRAPVVGWRGGGERGAGCASCAAPGIPAVETVPAATY
jgi:hypothetical protein